MESQKYVDCDYSEFLNSLNIYSLNEEMKKINRMNECKGSSGWSSLQKKEFISLRSYMNEKYPIINVATHIKEKHQQIRRPRFKEYERKIALENKKYKMNKEFYLQLINEKKEILMNETKNKEKQKALEDIICECGLISKRTHISRHRKSATHIKLMAITKETPICVEVPKKVEQPIINEKEEKRINKEFEKLMKEEPIIEEINEDEEEEEANKYYNMPLIVTEEKEEDFRELYNVKWYVKLLIQKNVEWRKKWYKDNDVLFPIYKLDENGNETKEVIGIC